MTLEECYRRYGEPLYVGSKHLVWKDPYDREDNSRSGPSVISLLK